MNCLLTNSQALFYPKNMFETSILFERFSLYVKKTRGETSIVWIKIIEDHDAVHAIFHTRSAECSNV